MFHAVPIALHKEKHGYETKKEKEKFVFIASLPKRSNIALKWKLDWIAIAILKYNQGRDSLKFDPQTCFF